MDEHSNLVTSNNQSPDNQFDLSLFIYTLRKNILWVLFILSLTILGIVLTLRYTVPIYRVAATIQIEKNDRANQLLQVDELYETSDISGEIELLKSKYLITKAIESLPLKIGYFSKGKFLEKDLYTNSPFKVVLKIADSSLVGKQFFVDFPQPDVAVLSYVNIEGTQITHEIETNTWTKLNEFSIKVILEDYETFKNNKNQVKQNEFFFTILDKNLLASQLSRNLSISILNPSAKTLQISFTDENPFKARDLVAAIIAEFKVYDINRRKKSSSRIIEFIEDQLNTVSNRQRKSESSIQEFKRDNQILGNKEFSSVYLDKLNELDNILIESTIQQSILQEIKNKLNVDPKNIDVYQIIPILIGSDYQGSLEEMIKELNNLLIAKQNILYTSTDKSDQVKTVNYQIEVQKNLLIKSIDAISNKMASRIEELEKSIVKAQTQFYGIPEKEIELSRLQRSFEIDEKFYTMLLERRTEYSISEAGFVSQSIVLEEPRVPSEPESPNKQLIIFGFSIAGIIVSLSLLLIRYLLHNQITTIEDIKKLSKTTFSILGIVPKYKKDIPVSQLVVDENPKSLIAESFRTIRTNLEFISSKKGPKLMAVTSTISREGKTFVAINIGGIIAYSGKKVILLDLDMRKPKVHVGFSVDNEKGMSTLLIEKDELSDCIQKSQLKNLDFITAGPIPPNPSELIINGKLDEIIETLKLTYDLVIIDNPPVGLVTDGISIIQKADYPIYVVRSEYSKKNFIPNIDKLIIDNKISKLSVILNGFNAKATGYGYGGQYGYGYGNGYGYYEENEDKKSKLKTLFKKNSQ
tara:strand:+ start:3913 stop:6336 length:2424 start_codon:yes stop_codon:yes gene_type:complete